VLFTWACYVSRSIARVLSTRAELASKPQIIRAHLRHMWLASKDGERQGYGEGGRQAGRQAGRQGARTDGIGRPQKGELGQP